MPFHPFNPFKMLRVSMSCSPQDIRKAYVKRAKETHPDQVKGREEEYVKVKRAFEMLSNGDFRFLFENCHGNWGWAWKKAEAKENLLLDKGGLQDEASFLLTQRKRNEDHQNWEKSEDRRQEEWNIRNGLTKDGKIPILDKAPDDEDVIVIEDDRDDDSVILIIDEEEDWHKESSKTTTGTESQVEDILHNSTNNEDPEVSNEDVEDDDETDFEEDNDEGSVKEEKEKRQKLEKELKTEKERRAEAEHTVQLFNSQRMQAAENAKRFEEQWRAVANELLEAKKREDFLKLQIQKEIDQKNRARKLAGDENVARRSTEESLLAEKMKRKVVQKELEETKDALCMADDILHDKDEQINELSRKVVKLNKSLKNHQYLVTKASNDVVEAAKTKESAKNTKVYAESIINEAEEILEQARRKKDKAAQLEKEATARAEQILQQAKSSEQRLLSEAIKITKESTIIITEAKEIKLKAAKTLQSGESLQADLLKKRQAVEASQKLVNEKMLEAEKKNLKAEEIKREAEQNKREADKMKMESVKIKTDADKMRTEAEQNKREAEKMKMEAEKMKMEAEIMKKEAEIMKNEAEKMRNAQVLFQEANTNSAQGESTPEEEHFITVSDLGDYRASESVSRPKRKAEFQATGADVKKSKENCESQSQEDVDGTMEEVVVTGENTGILEESDLEEEIVQHGRVVGSTTKCKCGKVYKQSQGLSRHLSTKKKDANKFVCSVCSRGFPRKDNYIRHIETAHKESTTV